LAKAIRLAKGSIQYKGLGTFWKVEKIFGSCERDWWKVAESLEQDEQEWDEAGLVYILTDLEEGGVVVFSVGV